MMSDLPTPQSTSDEAVVLLGAVTKGEQAGTRLSASARGPLRYYSLALAALVGAYFLVIVYMLPLAEPGSVWAATAIYLVVLAIVVVGYLRARKATAPRANRRLLIGTAATVALFLVGTFLSTVIETRSPLLWIACTVVMVLPLAVSTVSHSSR